MDISYKRNELKKLYNGSRGWVEKVNNMSDKQVETVYSKMVHSGKFDDIYKRR